MSKEFSWVQIFVNPVSAEAGARLARRLDEVLTSMCPAHVEQQLRDGQYHYEPEADGTFIVRVLDASGFSMRMVKGMIKDNGFTIEREVGHE